MLLPRSIGAPLAIMVWCALSTALIGGQRNAVSTNIDQLIQKHWEPNSVEPAELADDATFLRRSSLDLLGRIPTVGEVEQFLADKASDKHFKLIQRLTGSPEFPLHFGNVLDQMIQGRYAGNEAFVDYLRCGLRDGKSWDVFFREMMIGPWDSDDLKPANRFLDKRAKTFDTLASDAARVFFGVDISCAKCHNHPMVDDWTQHHFYGMASFFHRTTGGKGSVSEKTSGDLKFMDEGGVERVAKLMFLSGEVIAEPSEAELKSKNIKRTSRRKQLVEIALVEKTFFSRSFVNRMWEYFFGQGLVTPVDQMHSQNRSAVAGLLESLADQFVANGYDVRKLVIGIVGSRVYRLSSEWNDDSPLPDERLFAVALLRPLSRQQLAFSMLLATGGARLTESDQRQSRVEKLVGVKGIKRVEDYLSIEQRGSELSAWLDARSPEFQSSAGEALFMSNHEMSQKLIGATEQNLTGQLSSITDSRQIVETALVNVFSRPSREEELTRLVEWFDRQEMERSKKCELLVWALIASAEFRFNH